MYKIQKHGGKYCLLKKEKDWVFVGSTGEVVKEKSLAKESLQLSEIYAFIEELAS